MSTGVMVAGNIVLTAVQLYLQACKQNNMTKEQAKAYFLDNYGPFMDETAGPVEPVSRE